MCEQAQEQRKRIEKLETLAREFVQYLRDDGESQWAKEVLEAAQLEG